MSRNSQCSPKQYKIQMHKTRSHHEDKTVRLSLVRFSFLPESSKPENILTPLRQCLSCELLETGK